MKNIFKIFGKDIMGLVKNILAMVIAVGLCFLPALYAWFNIYANWDPYGNTGNVNIAVANLDEGWKNESGEVLNMGDGIVESLNQPHHNLHLPLTSTSSLDLRQLKN